MIYVALCRIDGLSRPRSCARLHRMHLYAATTVPLASVDIFLHTQKKLAYLLLLALSRLSG